ncbi:hypothetical protein JOE11_003004 [Robbsia andropogonis]
MGGFRDRRRAQRFLSSFGSIRQHFAPNRHLLGTAEQQFAYHSLRIVAAVYVRRSKSVLVLSSITNNRFFRLCLLT